MNELVEYLAGHYDPKGNSFRIVLIPALLEKSGYTIEEVFELAMEAYREKPLLVGRIRVKGNRWGVDQMIPEDLDTVAITRKGLAWHKESGAMQLHRAI
jgi:hypothetical protein